VDKNIALHEAVIFALSKSKSPAEVTLRSAEWAVITQVDGQKTVGEVAEVLAMDLDEALNLFNELYEKGLLELISTRKVEEKFLPAEFFDILENELTRIIGPVAPYVIEDVLWAMEANKDQFAEDREAELIEAISEEIPDEHKKVLFQQSMLSKMKDMHSE